MAYWGGEYIDPKDAIGSTGIELIDLQIEQDSSEMGYFAVNCILCFFLERRVFKERHPIRSF